jgi:hypothetical protein
MAGRRRGPDAEGGAELAEGVAVRALAVDAEDLVDVLVGHLVLEDGDDLDPGTIEDERARELDGAGGANPGAEPGGRVEQG